MAGMLAVDRERMTVVGRNIGMRFERPGSQVHRRCNSDLKRLDCLGEDCLGIFGDSRSVDLAVVHSKRSRHCRRTNNRGQVLETWLLWQVEGSRSRKCKGRCEDVRRGFTEEGVSIIQAETVAEMRLETDAQCDSECLVPAILSDPKRCLLSKP